MRINIPRPPEWLPSAKGPPAERKSAVTSLQPLGELPGILPPSVTREFRGINTLDSLSIGDNFATQMKNMDGYPFLETRRGFSVMGAAIGSKVIGLGTWKDTELHAIFSDGTWRRWTGSAWSSALVSGLDTSTDWHFTNFKGNYSDVNLIASNGSTVRRYDGSTVQTLSGPPAGIKFIEQFADRLFGAKDSTLHFSGWRDAGDWSSATGDAAASGWIEVETPDGEDIVAVKPGIGHVTVFKPNSIHELFGYSPEDYTMQPVTYEVGAVNNKSIINIGGALYFVHPTGIYLYQGGMPPSKDFSLTVQKYIDGMDKGRTSEICAATDGLKLYFYIPSRLLVYDLLHQIWNVYEDTTPNVMVGWNNTLYIGAERVYQPATNANGVNFEWITKPFGAGSFAQKVRWYRMYIVADVPIGSSLQVHLSKTIDGNDWTLAQTVTGASNIQQARIIIPVTTVADSNWVRVRFSGTGYVKIHEFTRQVREMPIV